MQTDRETQAYFDSIQKEVENAYSIATSARAKGKDPETTVEILLAEDLAARVEGLVSTFFPTLFGSGLKDGIRVLEEKYGKNDERVALLIGRDVAVGKYGDFGSKEKFAEVGLRIAVAYLTLGIVTAPLEGISKVLIKKNDDGTEYLAVYYAGPIRSAGGTASAISVLAADFIRKALKIDAYKPTDVEINRYFVEVEDYYTRVTAKQYHPTKEEMTAIIKNVPVEITGDPTEELEVSNYKDLPRVETNKIRGGMCLILLDGIPLKAEKVLGRVKKYPDDYDLKNWLWLADFVKLKNSIHAAKKVELKDAPNQANALKYTPKDTYLSKVLAGRPIFAHPSKRGGFRLRYGRSRTAGLAATSLHPAVMWLTEFIAVGTQLATEFPGKATVCAPCDTIDPPVVKLRSGSIVELRTHEEVKHNKNNVLSILSMGDILVPYGEFVSNNHMLMPSAYCEEWWLLELKKAVEGKETKYKPEDYAAKPPALSEAFDISRELGVPLHPEYNFFWHDLSIEELRELIQWFSTAKTETDAEGERVILQMADSFRILEILCTPCTVKDGNVALSGKSLGAYYSLGKPNKENAASLMSLIEQEMSVMPAVSKLAGIRVRERGLTRIGIRMGRPEKAEKRLLKGRPQILFPCGAEGGKMRNLMESYASGKSSAEFPVFKCPSCSSESVFPLCQKCNVRGKAMSVCQSCNALVDAKMHCNQPTKKYRKMTVALKDLLDSAFRNMSIVELPKLFKGVRGVSGPGRNTECLEKGVLRTKYELYVNKDGTTRYDASDISMTHFKPSELGVTVEKMKSIGYETDYLGNPLVSENQVIELKVQDIVISDNEEFSSVTYMINVSRFIDDLLVRFYELPAYYNLKTKEDLVGQLVVGLAPHTSAGIVGRVVGFTRSKVCYAHPFWHAGKRRNCLLPSTDVLVFNSDNPKIMALKEIYNSADLAEKTVDDFGALERKVVGLKALAMNKESGQFELKEIVSVIKTPAPQHTVKITTKSGRVFVSSQEHRMQVFSEGKIVNKKVLEIGASDMLLVPEKIHFEDADIQEIDLLLEFLKISPLSKDLCVRGARKSAELCISAIGGLNSASQKTAIKKKTLSNYVYRDSIPLGILELLLKLSCSGWGAVSKDCRLGFKRNFADIPRIAKIDGHFMRLLGYYLSEGYARSTIKSCYQVSMSSEENDLNKDMVNCIKRVFRIMPSRNKGVIVISNRAVYHFFVDILKLGKGAKSKRIPPIFASLPKPKIKELLRAYFSGDGSVEKNRLHVSCSSASEKLLRDIGLQLLRFGIFYRMKTETRSPTGVAKAFYDKKGRTPVFTLNYLSIRSTYARKFFDDIGFFSSRKNLALEKCVETEKLPRLQKFGAFILDEIKEKELSPSNHEYLYDIEVKDHHNFLINDFILSSNCDGDEDSIMLLMDALLNFSRKFLPDTRGGRTMDAPLVLTSKLNPEEVDDEAWKVDISTAYPLEFYEDSMSYKSISELAKKPRLVSDVIKTPKVFHIGFTHGTTDVNDAPIKTKYVELGSMKDKVTAQLSLAEKIVAVNKDAVAEAVISKHFIRDIKGNLRTFSEQKVRCATCNAKYRRVPLIGKCYCGGKLMLSVSEGAIRKYIEPTKHIIEMYKISPYLFQQFQLLERDVDSLFGKKARQLGLGKFNAK